jgi:hypothetical protein
VAQIISFASALFTVGVASRIMAAAINSFVNSGAR